jgi:hypothetical protein
LIRKGVRRQMGAKYASPHRLADLHRGLPLPWSEGPFFGSPCAPLCVGTSSKATVPKEKADEYRARRGLRDRLESYLAQHQHPDFTLKKCCCPAALPKGAALRSLNDIDVAC